MRRLLPASLLLALVGCSADIGLSTDRGGVDADQDTASRPDDDGNGGAGGPGNGSADTGLPPESEDDPFRLRPAQTDVYVFVANPERDTVTRVQVLTQAVDTTRVGHHPTAVEVTSDYRTAVVFNQGDDSVSILDTTTLEQAVVPVRDNLNALALSPDGKWAVLWHDVAAERPGDAPPGAASSYNEVSLVDVQGKSHVPLVVGFNPKVVRFTPDGNLALVVADASIAAIRLDVATPVPAYIEIADPLSPPVAEEVVVAPDGSYAFVRQRDADTITIVDLLTEVVRAVDVAPGPTDLDLTADGLSAIVVSRTAHQVSLFELADPFAAPRVVDIPNDEPLGSVLIGEDQVAILYTTTGATSRYATWDTTTDDVILRPLPKPVAGIARTPTGTSLLVVHDTSDNADGSTPTPYQGKSAISLVSLTDFRANTIALRRPVAGYANSGNGRRGYLILDGLPYLEVLDYSTLIYDEVPLRSTPRFVGVLPDLDTGDADEPPAWVSQEHPLGRISFYDPDDASLETITGFELNGSIEE